MLDEVSDSLSLLFCLFFSRLEGDKFVDDEGKDDADREDMDDEVDVVPVH